MYKNEKKEKLINQSKEIVQTLGFFIKSKTSDTVIAPYTLYPTPIPKVLFDEAVARQQDFQLLLWKVANNYDFLWKCLEDVVKVDQFTGQIWKIYETVHKEGNINPLNLALVRNDYMIDNKNKNNNNNDKNNLNNNKNYDLNDLLDSCSNHGDNKLKQVEMNTISISFGGLGQQIHHYHRYIVGKELGASYVNHVPPNTACTGLAEGLIEAWKLYGNKNSVVLFLCYDDEKNVFDQRHLELEISRLNKEVKVIRRSFNYLIQHLKSNDDRKLFVDDFEVALVYQRSCYKPEDFKGEESWQCRLTMERSKAIMCPNAGWWLAGTKKVQQMLASENEVKVMIDNEVTRKNIMDVFVKQYSFDHNESGNEALNLGISNFQDFVVKPQREGGGNNYYGEQIPELLNNLKESPERSAYILMERIHPVVNRNIPVVSSSSSSSSSSFSSCEPQNMVSELGIFGFLLSNKSHVLLNKEVGYILRTKRVGTEEGGVATGYSVLDSPYIF